MRRACLLLSLLAIALPSAADAQNFGINAHATVTSSVSLVQQADLTFGAVAVIPGIAATVAPANGGRARVDYNEPASITAPAYVMIGGPGGAQLRVDLLCAQDPSATATAPVAFINGCSGGFIPTLIGNVGGTRYIYFGGTVVPAASIGALAGTYTGSFTVTATYVVY